MGDNDLVAILLARMGSHRLPGKPLRRILGEPMLGRMIDRIRKAPSLRRLVLATTALREDDPLEAFARGKGLEVFRGSCEDVLGRVRSASEWARAGDVVLLLADNPLVHADLIEEVVSFYRRGAFDYAANLTREVPHAPPEARRFPVGIRVQILSAQALARYEEEARESGCREHPTLHLLRNPERFRLGFLQAEGRWSPLHRPGLSLAVNTLEEFKRVQGIFEQLYPADPNFSLFEVMNRWPSQEPTPGVTA